AGDAAGEAARGQQRPVLPPGAGRGGVARGQAGRQDLRLPEVPRGGEGLQRGVPEGGAVDPQGAAAGPRPGAPLLPRDVRAVVPAHARRAELGGRDAAGGGFPGRGTVRRWRWRPSGGRRLRAGGGGRAGRVAGRVGRGRVGRRWRKGRAEGRARSGRAWGHEAVASASWHEHDDSARRYKRNVRAGWHKRYARAFVLDRAGTADAPDRSRG